MLAKKEGKPVPKCSFNLNYDKNVTNESKPVAEEENTENKTVNFYSEQTYFIAPFFVVSIDTMKVLAPKISLESFVEQANDLNTLILALLGRQNNK